MASGRGVAGGQRGGDAPEPPSQGGRLGAGLGVAGRGGDAPGGGASKGRGEVGSPSVTSNCEPEIRQRRESGVQWGSEQVDSWTPESRVLTWRSTAGPWCLPTTASLSPTVKDSY